MNSGKRISTIFTKLFHFEYWPYWIFYFPMYFYGIYLALKSGSAMYFSTTNPGMKYSGVVGESKYKVLSSIPNEFTPKTIFISASTSCGKILKIIYGHGFNYPFIVKPDTGERGTDVELIHEEAELKNYLADKTNDLNIQEFIDLSLEFGVMYHRMPDAEFGNVTSVVQKGFLSISGDGKTSIKELLTREIRAVNRIDYFENKLGKELDNVLPKGEKMNLEPIGNHCRGTTFYNANHLINEQLNAVFNNIATQIDGYYYGRFDLKVNSLEDLYSGKNMKIIELNGVSSEVAHVYDPNYKLIQAYKDIATHMNYIYQIARKNHDAGYPYDSLWTFLKDLWAHLKR